VRKIEPLVKFHDRNAFDCGSEPLNLFLKLGFVSLPSNELELFLPVATIREALAQEV
jgi:hypothetical protein